MQVVPRGGDADTSASTQDASSDEQELRPTKINLGGQELLVFAELEDKLGKAVAAIQQNLEQLCFKGVALEIRLSLLHKLVAQKLLFGAENVTLTTTYLDRLDG
eukprot:9739928-Karenia_brevis.AAC.1